MPEIRLMGKTVVDFMRSYRAQLAYYAQSGETAPINMCTPGPVARTLEFPSGTIFSMKVVEAAGAATIELRQQVGAWDTGIRYLPWQPDRCTYVRMDANAALVFTGPLTGCNVYVAGPKTDPVLFHTNSNTSGDNLAANNADKQTMTLNLLAANVLGLAPATLIGGRLERASYSGNFLGFVFGQKNGADWEFYFNGLGAGSSKLSRIF